MFKSEANVVNDLISNTTVIIILALKATLKVINSIILRFYRRQNGIYCDKL